jgi:hypothetical protein
MDEPKNTGNAGKGRQKGVPNKTTGLLKDMIMAALNDAGGHEYLVEQAHANPKAFLALVGRVLPMQVHGSGEDGEIIHKVVREIVRPAHTDS